MRVVLDTNVLISAFVSRGMCSELLEHCARRHLIIASEFILGEFTERLVNKFNYTETEAAEATDVIRTVVKVVVPTDLGDRVCRDPDDDIVLGTAVAGSAACVVTGDADLLVLGEFRGVRILRPAEFLEFESNV